MHGNGNPGVKTSLSIRPSRGKDRDWGGVKTGKVFLLFFLPSFSLPEGLILRLLTWKRDWWSSEKDVKSTLKYLGLKQCFTLQSMHAWNSISSVVFLCYIFYLNRQIMKYFCSLSRSKDTDVNSLNTFLWKTYISKDILKTFLYPLKNSSYMHLTFLISDYLKCWQMICKKYTWFLWKNL